MARNWTFGQKLGAGFALAVALTLAISAVAIYSLDQAVASKDRVIDVNAHRLMDAARLRASFEEKSAASRGYLLSGEPGLREAIRSARAEFLAIRERLARRRTTDEAAALLTRIERAERAHQEAADAVIEDRRRGAAPEEVAAQFESHVRPARDRLVAEIEAFVALEEHTLEEAKQAASSAASSAITLVIAVSVVAALAAIVLAFVLSRSLGRQIGATVGQVQSSSAELQAAASQQATGAKEQATAVNEITTTISELLATSRQIAESAQRVAHIAEDTARAARLGDTTVEKGNEAIGGIRRQVDLIVSNMLELGKKSQQIGAVLDIVSELAEQTNILAINATIEAAGAGESGRRFAVVAEEIRKLADRVGGSTKEVRVLIDDVRSAVNTTVMTTETGSKAVEAGARQFGEVAGAFKQIGVLVSTTTEAAREIELSTKQQTTAVEQVNLAITNVAQAARETEASTGQTLQTASQLSTLSRELLLLVRNDPVGTRSAHREAA